LCPGTEGPTVRDIRIPTEVGASDWTLPVEFQDGGVAAIRAARRIHPAPEMDRKTGRKTQANLPPCPLQRVGSEDTPPASAFGLAADALDGDVAGRALGGAVVARGAAAQGPAADRAAPGRESGGRFGPGGAPERLALEALS